MPIINTKSIYIIAKKEFMDNIRNKWIIAMIIIFLLLTILSSYLAAGQTGGEESLGGMEDTVVTLLSISTLLIPIIAIMLGYSTISGEAESGSLSIVLSYPIKRIEVLIGKLIGLGSVLFFSNIIGFGFGGAIIALSVGTAEGLSFLLFILLTSLLGLVFLSLSICISSICKKRVTSIAGGILIFFWAMIFGMIIFAILLASGVSLEQFLTPGFEYPDWLFTAVFFSPSDLYQVTVMKGFGLSQAFGFSMEFPEYMSLGLLVFAEFIWLIIPMIFAYIFFKKRDV
jgi:ABC-type transport system involved in multi-copper enzyme maturation permease subunit